MINAYIKDSRGRTWIGTEDGVLMIDGGNSYQFFHDPKSNKSLSNKAVNCIFEDSRHQIWLGLWNGGLNRYNEKTMSFDFFLHDPKRANSLGNPNVFSIFEYSETKELMVCTFGGLYILKDDRGGGTFEGAVDMSVEGNQLMLAGMEDSNNNIWIGAYTGLFRFHPESHKFEKFYLNRNSTDSNDRVNCIFEDSRERFWIGSSEGLHLMLENGEFLTYNQNDGLPVNYVVGILEDGHGNLWLGTTNGLTWFDPEKKTFKTYNEDDGLSTSEFRRKAFFKSDDGSLYVGGKGLNMFHPDSLSVNLAPPEVYLTELRVFNQPITQGSSDGILKHSIKETYEIQLDYHDTFFSIHYVGINLTSSYKNQYAYMLEGFDNQWNYVGDQRFATFTNLDPGTYYFRVRASNNDGIWNEKGAALKITINPPLWKTWWFRTFGILLLLALAFGFYFYRISAVKAINLRLESQVNERTQELKSRNDALARSEEAVGLQNEALIQKRNEIAGQRDLLAEQNRQLGEAKLIIEQQNAEILKQNQGLEEEVDRRTKELYRKISSFSNLRSLRHIIFAHP
ncbi:MAG: two-component regulator propeller domain-containing protein [Cyclobacteriaceae bacterium]|nr:two-component regulator propeller domain-containing protein [Cyclobacteriaceae bacterium]